MAALSGKALPQKKRTYLGVRAPATLPSPPSSAAQLPSMRSPPSPLQQEQERQLTVRRPQAA